MNEKLDKLFSFRDNDKFKIFTKIFTILTLAYFLVVMGFICAGKSIALMIFMVIPCLLITSFLRKNDYFFLIAEFITMIADFVLILYHKEIVGFPIYIFVQLSYAVYFFFRDPNQKREILISILRPFFMLIGVGIGFLVLKNSLTLEKVFGIMYIVNLIINIICAIIVKDPILIVGFSLFLISDTTIAFNLLLDPNIPFMKFMHSFNFMHFFYLTSQVVLMFNRYNNNYQEEYKRRKAISNK